MQNPPPPSQQQAEAAQRARYAAEAAIRSLISARSTATTSGEGGGNQSSSLHAVKIGMILADLSRSIKRNSFRRSTGESLLLSEIPDDEVAGAVLTEAQRAFERLAASELPDGQAAVLWATWAHSRTADEIARIINSGEVEHEFSGTGLALKKVWISRSDRKVRALHTKLHGKVVSADKDFWRWPDTGQRLRWPGDVEAPLDATAGCRCVSLLTWADQDGVSSTIRRFVEDTDSLN